jgi:hypothetical protein
MDDGYNVGIKLDSPTNIKSGDEHVQYINLSHYTNQFEDPQISLDSEGLECNVPDLASLGNAANVCVGSMVYNI